MDEDACPMPQKLSPDEEQAVQNLLQSKRIAVVGLSADPWRPSHYVSEYLMGRGYEIIPVNPAIEAVLGKKSCKSLEEAGKGIDLVLVFRRSEHCAAVAEEAAKVGAKGIWLQSGIRSDEARRIAAEAGMEFVQDRCMMMERMRHG